MGYFLSAILPLLISTGVSVWLIPYIITQRTKNKRKIIISLALGELIKEINQIFEEVDCLDNTKRTSIFVSHKNTHKFICLALAFNNELYKDINHLLFLKANKSYSYSELIKKYENEIERLSYLRTELLNISIRFSDLLSNKIIEQISEVCFEISNLNYNHNENKIILKSFEGANADVANLKMPASSLCELYKKLFNLQHNLLNLNYFKKKLQLN